MSFAYILPCNGDTTAFFGRDKLGKGPPWSPPLIREVLSTPLEIGTQEDVPNPRYTSNVFFASLLFHSASRRESWPIPEIYKGIQAYCEIREFR